MRLRECEFIVIVCHLADAKDLEQYLSLANDLSISGPGYAPYLGKIDAL